MKRTDITALLPDVDKDVLDKIMDLHGADITKAKGDLDAVKSQLATTQTELKTLKAKPPAPESGADSQVTAKVAELQAEIDALKSAATVRALRDKVSKDTGVPAELLTGDTEDACKTQAEAIQAYAKAQPGYPALKDGGEVGKAAATATRDKFAEWAKDAL